MGKSNAELLGKSIYEVFPEFKGSLFEEKYLEASVQGRATEVEGYFPPLKRWFSVKAYPVPGKGVACYYRDITSRKREEERLQESEQRFRSAVAAVTALLWTNNADGKMIGDQPGWSNFTGQTFSQYQGLGWTEAIHPEDLTPTLDAWKRAVAKKELFSFEHRVRRFDGAWRLFAVRAMPSLDVNGTVREWVGVHTDITEKRSAEVALQESELQFRELAESMPQLAWIANADGWIFWYNRRWYDYTGTTPEAMNGWGWQSVHDPQELPRVMEKWQASIKTGAFFEMVFPLKSAGGDFRPFLTRVTPMRGANGDVVRWFGTNTDITEQKLTEQALNQLISERTAALEAQATDLQKANIALQASQQELEVQRAGLLIANRELEAFSYTVSHDLRTPLRGIDGFRQLIGEKFGSVLGAEGIGYLNRIQKSTKRMAQLIDDLLALSHISRTKMTQESVDLAAIGRDIAQNIEARDGKKALFVAPTRLLAQGDPRLLRTVLENLLENAYKFTQHTESPRVELGCEMQHGLSVYFVRDNGAGFDMAYKNQLFVPFQRLHTSDEFPGTGIGLATVHRIIERHGGEVWAEGQPNRGATVYFQLKKP